ncbi:MAG: hypothetical protein WCK98_06520 [bacterium]
MTSPLKIIKSKTFLVGIAIFVILTIGSILIFFFFKNKSDIPPISDKVEKELAIEQYQLKEESNGYFRSPNSKFFCSVEVLWEYDYGDKEKVVYAPNLCLSYTFENKKLKEESGGVGVYFFKLTNKDGKWLVVEADTRKVKTTKELITQTWVEDTEKKLPEDIRNKCLGSSCVSDKLVKKADEYFKSSN